MDDKLKKYLAKCTPATVDPATLDDLRSAMERGCPENRREHQAEGATGCPLASRLIEAISGRN